MKILNFGKYSGVPVKKVAQKNPQYIVWVYETIPDHGGITEKRYDWCLDRIAKYPGVRPYEKVARVALIPEDRVTHYADGSGVRHCGGPGGDLYFDRFGNT